MAQAQLSFHGHRDAVKFFVAVPGSGGLSAATSETPLIENMELEALETKKPAAMLVMSGGEGYIDFRIGDGEEDEVEGETESIASSQQHEQQEIESRGERSHLIVWQVAVQD
jgi:mitogen-activated protein kinase 8 interacting protein 3